jgi:hypothetical protein
MIEEFKGTKAIFSRQSWSELTNKLGSGKSDRDTEVIKRFKDVKRQSLEEFTKSFKRKKHRRYLSMEGLQNPNARILNQIRALPKSIIRLNKIEIRIKFKKLPKMMNEEEKAHYE